MTEILRHKRGDSFELIATLPEQFPDGHFSGWSVASQVRRSSGELVADLETDWVDAATTRHIHLQRLDTTTWPVSTVYMDVQFTRQDGYTLSTSTVNILVEKDVTRRG
jgi:hypothetical protein